MKGFTLHHVEIKSRNTLSLSKVFSKINLLMLTKLDRYVMPNTCHRTFKGKSNFYFKDVLKEFQIYLYLFGSILNVSNSDIASFMSGIESGFKVP